MHIVVSQNIGSQTNSFYHRVHSKGPNKTAFLRKLLVSLRIYRFANWPLSTKIRHGGLFSRLEQEKARFGGTDV